jgi:hypothetical protein
MRVISDGAARVMLPVVADSDMDPDGAQAISAPEQAAPAKPKRSRARRIGAAFLVFLACVTSVAAVVAGWARWTLLDTDRFVSVVAPLASDPDVDAALAARLTEDISALVDEQAFFERVIPGEGTILATVLANAVDRFIGEKVDAFLQSDQFADFWERAVRVAHSRAIAVLKGDVDADALVTVNGQIMLDLVPVVNNIVHALADQVPFLVDRNLPDLTRDNIQSIADRLGIELKPDFALIPVFDESKLDAAQTALRTFDRLTIALIVLAIVLAVAAIIVSVNRRRTVLLIALGIALGMIAARRLTLRLQEDIVDIVTNPLNEAAASATTKQVLSSFLDLLAWIIIGGLAVAIIAFLAGPSGPVVKLRRGLRGAREGATERAEAVDWMVSYRDALRIGIAAVAVVILLAFDLSWVTFLILLAVVAVAEIVLSGLPGVATTDGDAS